MPTINCWGFAEEESPGRGLNLEKATEVMCAGSRPFEGSMGLVGPRREASGS